MTGSETQPNSCQRQHLRRLHGSLAHNQAALAACSACCSAPAVCAMAAPCRRSSMRRETNTAAWRSSNLCWLVAGWASYRGTQNAVLCWPSGRARGALHCLGGLLHLTKGTRAAFCVSMVQQFCGMPQTCRRGGRELQQHALIKLKVVGNCSRGGRELQQHASAGTAAADLKGVWHWCTLRLGPASLDHTLV